MQLGYSDPEMTGETLLLISLEAHLSVKHTLSLKHITLDDIQVLPYIPYISSMVDTPKGIEFFISINIPTSII